MIPRYTPSDFAELWSDRTRYRTWLKVELAACEAMEHAGIVPKGTAGKTRAMGLDPDPAAIEAIEAETRHDVIAFLTHIERMAGEPARWLHRGMTSSDVLDSSFALLLSTACDRLLERSQLLIAALSELPFVHAVATAAVRPRPQVRVTVARVDGLRDCPRQRGIAVSGGLLASGGNWDRTARGARSAR